MRGNASLRGPHLIADPQWPLVLRPQILNPQSHANVTLDTAWFMHHIGASVATWRRDVGVGENMMARRTTLASYFAVCSFLLACAGRHPTPEALAADDSPAVAPEPIVLEVENHNWADVVLYVVHEWGPNQVHPGGGSPQHLDRDPAPTTGSDGSDSHRCPPDRRHRQLRFASGLDPGKHRGSIDDRKQPEPLEPRSLVESICHPEAACCRRFRRDRRLPWPPEMPRRLSPPPSGSSSARRSCSSPRSLRPATVS